MITLFDHQVPRVEQGLEILKELKLLYLAMEMRTGKTITSLEIARRYGARYVLFITKIDAIPDIQKDYNALGKPFLLKTINYQRLHEINKLYDLIIVDEGHTLGAFPKPGSWHAKVKRLVHDRPLIILSGTPNPNSYSELFHQYSLSKYGPWNHYQNFYFWARDYVQVYELMVNSFTKKMYDKADSERIKKDIAPYIITCSQEEANFLCEINENIRWLPMPDTLRTLYQRIERERIVEYGDEVCTCSNGADVINKLGQLSGGSIIFNAAFEETEDENVDELATKKKPGVVLDDSKAKYIKENFRGKKIAIFYLYKAEEEAIRKNFDNITKSHQEFQQRNDLVFISQITSNIEGVDLSSADALLMYNISFSARCYFQVRARIQHKKRKISAPIYWLFFDTGIEQKVMARVQKKKDFTYDYYAGSKAKAKPLDLRRPTGQNTANNPEQTYQQLSILDMLDLAKQL